MSKKTILTSPESDEQQRQKVSAASWVDWLMAAIERLPGPPWLAYVVLTLVLALLAHMLRWVDGSLPLGTLDLTRLAEVPLVFYFLALMHYLNRSARTSISIFSPLLEAEDTDIQRLQHEIATIPRRVALTATGVGFALSVSSVMSNPASWGITDTSSIGALIYAHVIASIVFVFGLVFIVHTIRQLRLVNKAHAMVSNINLWHRQPVYAFSTLTAQTGAGIVLMMYYYVLITFTLDLYGPVDLSLFDAVSLVFFMLLAIASFMLPLYGMQRKLTLEKRRLVAEADRRFERTLARLHELVDSENFDGIDGLNKSMTSLQIERDALTKIPTWPWRPETFRGFISSIAIPIVLWLVTTLLGQALRLQ